MYRLNWIIKVELFRRLFDIDGRGIMWVVIDSGIDVMYFGFWVFDFVKE